MKPSPSLLPIFQCLCSVFRVEPGSVTRPWASGILRPLPPFLLLWCPSLLSAAAAAAESLQSCPTLCGPVDSSPAGSSAPGILQARPLEWVAISFSLYSLHSSKKPFSFLQPTNFFLVPLGLFTRKLSSRSFPTPTHFSWLLLSLHFSVLMTLCQRHLSRPLI